MLVKVNSTRDTAVGLFRAGVVYDVQDFKAKQAVKPHTEKGGPFVVLKGKAAEAAMADAVKIIGPADAEAAADDEAAVDAKAAADAKAANEAGEK